VASNKGLVLGFSGINPREIIDGVQVLAEVLEKLGS
jgi:DNA-binding transcriptional MocR family regulator